MSDKIYITLDQYWMGRNITYKKELTKELIQNATDIVDCTNKLLNMAADDGVVISNQKVNSGWRPKSVNDKTPGSDPNSPHVDANGIDLGEYADRRLRIWINDNPEKVKEAGFVAIEKFSATPTWVHLQRRLPLNWQKGPVIFIPAVGGWQHWKKKDPVLKSLL